MANTYFQFKQFTVHQENCAMKVSTDAVTLGALATANSPSRILDIGTGTGVISLMLAQRHPNAHIDAIEIDAMAAAQARENFRMSPWHDRIQDHPVSFQDFVSTCTNRYSLIVSNPPYFTNHLKSRDEQRKLALHNDALPFGDLIKGVVKLLDRDKGQFWVILPPQQMKELVKIARFFNLHVSAVFELRDRPSSHVLREISIITFSSIKSQKNTILSIKNEDFSFSAAYKMLMKDFLLAF